MQVRQLETIARGIEAADNSDPKNFHHSEVRKLRKAFRKLLRIVETMEAKADRNTREEL